MKNKEVCTVNKEKLFNLVSKVIGLYQVIDDHCMLMEAAVSHCDRPRKTDMRGLSRGLLAESFDIFENIGCNHKALLEDDEDVLYEGIFDELEADIFDDTQEDNAPVSDFAGFLNALSKIISSDKPVTVSADIYINENDKDDETDEN